MAIHKYRRNSSTKEWTYVLTNVRVCNCSSIEQMSSWLTLFTLCFVVCLYYYHVHCIVWFELPLCVIDPLTFFHLFNILIILTWIWYRIFYVKLFHFFPKWRHLYGVIFLHLWFNTIQYAYLSNVFTLPSITCLLLSPLTKCWVYNTFTIHYRKAVLV